LKGNKSNLISCKRVRRRRRRRNKMRMKRGIGRRRRERSDKKEKDVMMVNHCDFISLDCLNCSTLF